MASPRTVAISVSSACKTTSRAAAMGRMVTKQVATTGPKSTRSCLSCRPPASMRATSRTSFTKSSKRCPALRSPTKRWACSGGRGLAASMVMS